MNNPDRFPNFDKQLDGLMTQYNLAQENLSREQFASCIKQMIAAGDFVRYVTVGSNGQQIVYEPFRHCQYLENRIKELEVTVKELEALVKELRDPCTN